MDATPVMTAADRAPMSTDPVRVLVVDDSPLVRSTVGAVLSAEPGIRVVGTAPDGEAALHAVEQLAPDVVTLDVDMPGVDGHEFLRRVRPKHPRLPIIVFSHLTRRYAATTIDAMFLGVTDYVGKPSKTGSAEAARLYLKKELVPKILAFGNHGKGGATSGKCHGAIPARATSPESERRVATDLGRASLDDQRTPPESRAARMLRAPVLDIVVVGSSTGGPAAIDAICRALPRSFALPVVIVQHMPPAFVPDLAERIHARSNLAVAVAQHGDLIGPGRILLAPGDHHLKLRRDGAIVTVVLDDAPPVNGCRPAVDVLFRSAAEAYGDRTLAVVLTGMGQDGLEGSQKIVESGGRVIVQDESSSVIWGMPGRIARAGLADAIVPLREIGGEIGLRARQSGSRG
jgi:two-component system chemotaxis response regulator CheB